VHKASVGKSEGKRLLGIPRSGWILKLILDKYMMRYRLHSLAQNRDQCRGLENTVMNLRVPRNAWNFLSG
jgi:hypothetical protein